MGDLSSQSHTASGLFSATPGVSYTYYPDGSRYTMSDATGSTVYTYDAMGDLVSQQLSAGGSFSSYRVSHTYFSTGQLASTIYPNYSSYGTPTVNYSYDALGNMASETDWLGNEVTFGHDGDGNLTSQDNAVSALNPNGTSSTTYSYDNADYNASASSSVANGCGVTQSFSGSPGSRNADGQVTEDYETFTGSCQWGQSSYERNYSYNTAGELVYEGSVAQGASSANFGYNAAGALNLISSHASSGGSLDTYNQTLSSTEAWAVTAQSPIAGGASSTYGYDAMGDLASVTSGPSTTTYGYDSTGQMVSVTSGLTTTSYQYTGDGLEAGATTQTNPWNETADMDHKSNGQTIPLWSVSCVSSSFCAAVDGYGNAVLYNGSGWSRTTGIDPSTDITGVSCVSSSFCMAVDANGDYLTYNGSTWTSPKGFASNQVAGVSCLNTTWCMAVDTNGDAWVWAPAKGQQVWTEKPLEPGMSFDAVSCTGVQVYYCAMVDALGGAYTYNYANGKTTWSQQRKDRRRDRAPLRSLLHERDVLSRSRCQR